MSDDIKYEYKSVQTMRGMENRSIAKTQKEGGWELVDQTQGTLRTTLNFRRVKPETLLSKAWDVFRGLAPGKQRAVAAAVAVLLLLSFVGIGIAASHSTGDTSAENTATKSTKAATETPTMSPTLIPSPTPIPSEKLDQVITAENNKDLAVLLTVGDYCDPSMAQFAAKYRGQRIAFDGAIANMQHHEKYETRYDILLGAGDAGPNTGVGPAFKYDNVNMFDLHLAGANIPSYVSEGDKFRFTAEVGTYNPKSCLFFLTPVSTTVR